MIEKRHIALFSTSFLPYSQTFIYDELKAHSNNYEVSVFCKTRINEDKFPYDNFYKPPNKMGEIFYQNRAYWPGFNKVFQEKKFDLIHAHFGTGAVYALHYAKKFNIPLIVTFHGNDVGKLIDKTFSINSLRYKLKAKEIFDKSHTLLAASNELKALLIEKGAFEDKIRIYRFGVDLNKFQYRESKPSDKIRFIMIGRFTEKKGHIYALKAFDKLIKSGFNSELVLVGGGTLESIFKDFAMNHNINKHIIFKGVLSANDVIVELCNSDVLVAPSIVTHSHDRESGLMVIKEAAAIGLPSIGTWHGGIPEIIDDNKTGFLVPERNIDELFSKMKNFVWEPNLISSLGKNARK